MTTDKPVLTVERHLADAAAEADDVILGLVMQFGYRTPGPKINSGALSAMEAAFDYLGWDDPHDLSENYVCDIENCRNSHESGMPWTKGGPYLRLCSFHTSQQFRGGDSPPVKERALAREAKRDEKGVLPHDAQYLDEPDAPQPLKGVANLAAVVAAARACCDLWDRGVPKAREYEALQDALANLDSTQEKEL